jgi:hypothetical protein
MRLSTRPMSRLFRPAGRCEPLTPARMANDEFQVSAVRHDVQPVFQFAVIVNIWLVTRAHPALGAVAEGGAGV